MFDSKGICDGVEGVADVVGVAEERHAEAFFLGVVVFNRPGVWFVDGFIGVSL